MMICTPGSFAQTFVFGVAVGIAIVIAVFLYRRKK